jgi:hypothetical protein
MDARRFGRPQHCSQVVWIFNPVKEHEKGLLASRLRALENLLRRVVGFRSDERNDTLVPSIWNETVESGSWFDVNWNLLLLGCLDEIAKLSIGPKD